MNVSLGTKQEMEPAADFMLKWSVLEAPSKSKNGILRNHVSWGNTCHLGKFLNHTIYDYLLKREIIYYQLLRAMMIKSDFARFVSYCQRQNFKLWC